MATDFTSGSKPEHLKKLLSLGLEESKEDEEIQPSNPLDLFIEKPGSRIGCYELKHILGEGAMAVVYLAQQQQPVKRRVALKIIKPGMDSKAIIARFEAERQALALLDHPNIAHIHDAGATEDKRPYFAMEYVEGLTITEYCDKHRLPIKERLDLFKEVCLAVHHAHQKGIIHRDIKPSNILVSLQDGRPVPKVIDFGLAKAISGSLSGRTLVTEQDQLLGTPEYMSPEQADMANEDIDIRSDIYSLGVLLYVLLTGVLPFDFESLREGGIEHIRQIIRGAEPKTPSTRLKSLGGQAQHTAENRQTEVTILVRRLQRELEWIPIKAMRKERSERYQSASELGEDIQSYLNGSALTAGPPSTIYRLKKIVRRNRALITGVAAVIAVSIAGTIISTVFAIKANQQARTSQKISNFLIKDLFDSVHEVAATRSVITVESLLDVSSEHLDGKFDKEPLIEASIRLVIGVTYYKVGNFEATESNMKRAIKLRRECLGHNDSQTLEWMMWLGWYYFAESKYDEAEKILEETVDDMKRILSDVHWNLLETISRLAWVYYEQDRLEKAEELWTGALDVIQRKFGPEHRYAPNHMEGLAFVYWKRGDHEGAIELNRKALEISLRDDWNPSEKDNITKSLAWMYTETGRYSEAEDLYLEGLELKRRMDAGDVNIYFLQRVGELGTMYRKWKRYDEAEQWLIKAEEIARRVFGDDHEITNAGVTNLIILYKAWNKPQQAKQWRAKISLPTP